MQLLATGELRDLDQVRSVVGASAKVSIYEPKDTDQWEQVYGQYKKMLE
jgi:rhamnulokinase/L-fuculokinase